MPAGERGSNGSDAWGRELEDNELIEMTGDNRGPVSLLLEIASFCTSKHEGRGRIFPVLAA